MRQHRVAVLEWFEEQREAARLQCAMYCGQRRLRIDQVVQDRGADREVVAVGSVVVLGRIHADRVQAAVHVTAFDRMVTQDREQVRTEVGRDDFTGRKQLEARPHRIARAGAEIEDQRRRGRERRLRKRLFDQRAEIRRIAETLVIRLRVVEELLGDAAAAAAELRCRAQDAGEACVAVAEIEQRHREQRGRVAHTSRPMSAIARNCVRSERSSASRFARLAGSSTITMTWSKNASVAPFSIARRCRIST